MHLISRIDSIVKHRYFRLINHTALPVSGKGGLGKSRMAENTHERLFRQAEHFDMRCACGRMLNLGTSSEFVADRWRANPRYRCENCTKNKVLDVRPIPAPIDNELWTDVVVACCSCDGSEIVHLTSLQWILIKAGYNAIPSLECAKCRGDVS